MNTFRHLLHETGYWYANTAVNNHIHSPKLSNWIINFLDKEKDKFVYDFGCGMGYYLNDLNNNGFTKLVGVEGEPIPNNYSFSIIGKNLSEPFNLGEKGNVIFLEVGEHIPKQYQDTVIDNVTNHCSDYLIMSWAVRGQDGLGHFNELNNDEVIPEFEKRGFKFLENETKDARQNVDDHCSYFVNTIMIFKKI